jgi:hypothetical protein
VETAWYAWVLVVCGWRIAFLIGVLRMRPDGTIRWPVHVDSWRMWKYLAKHEPWFGVFRNLPGVVRHVPGQLLPRRWGVRVIGFEFGDRG